MNILNKGDHAIWFFQDIENIFIAKRSFDRLSNYSVTLQDIIYWFLSTSQNLQPDTPPSDSESNAKVICFSNNQKFLEISKKKLLKLYSNDIVTIQDLNKLAKECNVCSSDEMIALISSVLEIIVKDNFNPCIIIMDMELFVSCCNKSSLFQEFEAKLDDFIKTKNARIICLYNRNTIEPNLLLHVISQHNLVIYDNHIMKNFYYMPSSLYLSNKREQQEFDLKLDMLVKYHEALHSADEGRAMFSGIVHSIPDYLYIVDKHYNIIWANDKLLDLFDLNIIGKKCYKIFHNISKPCKFCNIQPKKKQPHTHEFELTLPDGSSMIMACKGDILKYNKETDSNCFSIRIWKDITESKHYHELLERRHNELLSIFEAIDEIIYVTDPTTYEIVFVNSALKKMFGEEIIGKKCYKTFQRLDAPCEFCTNNKIFGENLGKSYVWEFRNLINKQWYKCIDKAILWPDGRYLRFELAINIDDIKKAEQAMRLAKEEAEKANQMKTRFLANMSHEIRTPMSGITGIIELLKETDLSEKQFELVELIRKSTMELSEVLNSILDISRIESGKVILDEVEFSIKEVILSVFRLFEKTAENKKLEYRYEFSASIPELLYGDVYKITQILRNLINNAVKFTDKGYVKVCANAEKIKQNEYKIFITIEDSGKGIAKERQSHIFNPFEQEDSSITRKYGGTGLGLAIVAGLIKLLKGSIHVQSEKGKGSKFTVVIPLKTV